MPRASPPTRALPSPLTSRSPPPPSSASPAPAHLRPNPPDDHPAGWYLLDLLVSPPLRRRGIATALTLHRLAWIARRADSAYYFAHSLDLPSIDLHHRLGFTEIRRPFTFPNSHLSAGGTRVLFRLHPLTPFLQS